LDNQFSKYETMKFNTLTKSIKILDFFLSQEPNLTENQISSMMKMPRSTTYKYLSILREQKLLDYDPKSGQYMLGSKLFEFSRAHYSHSGIDKIALPVMKRLYEEVEETVTLDVMINNKGYTLERVEKEIGMGFIVKRGSEIPLHCGASGQLLLAFSDDEDVELFLKAVELKKYTPKTVTDQKKLRKKLSEIKKDGYAYSEGEFQVGGRGVAAPVFDNEGKICASLCVASLAHNMNHGKIEPLIRTVIRYANEITDRLRLEGKNS
jgi:IclR family KDG regulon transcriptional repressor